MSTKLLTSVAFTALCFGQGGFNGPGTYEIYNVKSRKVIDMDRNDRSTILQFSSRGTDNQAWEVRSAGGNTYFLVNQMNGNALEAMDNRNSTPVRAMPFHGGDSQKWKIESSKDNTAVIMTMKGKVLDIPYGNTKDGEKIQTYDRNNNDNQRFTFQIARGAQSQTGGQGNRPGDNRGNRGNSGGFGNWTSGGTLVRCVSNGGRSVCDANTGGGVSLVRTLGNSSPCRQGETWGFDNRSIWVDRGCQAEFELGRGAAVSNSSGAVPMPAAGAASEDALRACKNEVANRYTDVPMSQITVQAAAKSTLGVQLVNWSTSRGSAGFCGVDSNNRVRDFRVERQ